MVKFGLGVLDKIVFGVWVSFLLGIKVVLLWIYFFFGYFGVKGLFYLGFFLVLRFSVRDERFFGVEMDLFVYGIFCVRKIDLLFVFGVIFMLSVKNLIEKEVNLFFLLNIFFGE